MPKVDFYQLKVHYETVVVEDANPERDIANAASKTAETVIRHTDFSLENIVHEVDDTERGTEPAVFSQWLYKLSRSSFGVYSMEQFNEYRDILRPVFETITYECGGVRCFSTRYDRPVVEANIRKAFCEKQSYNSRTERIPESASLLNITNFSSVIHVQETTDYFPAQDVVEKIILDDKGKLKPDKNTLQMMQLAEQTGQIQVLEILRSQVVSHPQKDRSFHHLPYHTDSSFEQTFLRETLPLPEVERFGLEVYYNGDRTMTEFKIKCYKSNSGGGIILECTSRTFLSSSARIGRYIRH